MPLSEEEIRAGLKKRARRFIRRDARVRVIEEVQVDGGKARIDMLFVGAETFGVEIKSARDNLSRLDTQSVAYARYFDYLVLATDEKFVPKAKSLLPDWWGIASVCAVGERLVLRRVRAPKRNPQIQVESLLELLWKGELLELLSTVDATRNRQRDSKKVLRRELLSRVSPTRLKQLSVQALFDRPGWRAR